MHSPDILCRLSLEEVYPHVLESLTNGTAVIRNGVARAVGDAKILQHLPFKPLHGAEGCLPEAMQQAAGAVPIASVGSITSIVAIGTAASMATTIACTAYLAAKIAEVERQIGQLSHQSEGLAKLMMLDRIASYSAGISHMRELLLTVEPLGDPPSPRNWIVAKWNKFTGKKIPIWPDCPNGDLISQGLGTLGQSRHHLLAFVDSLHQEMPTLDAKTQELAHKFVLSCLHLFPRMVLIEQRAAYAMGRWSLGDTIRQESQRALTDRSARYRSWANSELDLFIRGTGGEAQAWVGTNLQRIHQVVRCPVSPTLLLHSA